MAAAARARGTGSIYPDQTRGAGHWRVSVDAGWTANGSRRRVVRRVQGTERQARAVLAQLLRDPEPEAGRSPTVKAWADTWLGIIEHTARPGTYSANRSALRWIIPGMGHKRIDKLTPADLRNVDALQRDKGLAANTILRTRRVAVKMLKDAAADGHRVPASVLATRTPHKAESSRNAIPHDDAVKIAAAALNHPDGSRWLLALVHGIRPAEALGLTWECVDLTAEVVDVSWQLKPLPYRVKFDRTSGFRIPDNYTVRQLVGRMHLVRPKTKKGRRLLPIHPAVAEALRHWHTIAQPSPHGLVWPEPDGSPGDDKLDRERWHALCEEAKVPSYDLYEARHTSATEQREAGADDQTITAVLGHASILSSNSYLHHELAAGRVVAGKVGDALGL